MTRRRFLGTGTGLIVGTLAASSGAADRILIFYRGRLTMDLDAAGVDDREVLHAINTGSLEDRQGGIR
jgi:hypothetical protein